MTAGFRYKHANHNKIDRRSDHQEIKRKEKEQLKVTC